MYTYTPVVCRTAQEWTQAARNTHSTCTEMRTSHAPPQALRGVTDARGQHRGPECMVCVRGQVCLVHGPEHGGQQAHKVGRASEPGLGVQQIHHVTAGAVLLWVLVAGGQGNAVHVVF